MLASVRRRPGLTLIELMVVIGLILLLATLGVLFYPKLQDSSNMNRASDKVSQALANARARAKRDNLPTGIRFTVQSDTNGTLYSTEFSYIQQPDNYTTGACAGTPNPIAGTSPPQYNVVTFANVNFRGAASAVNVADQSTIQPGDYLEVFGGGGVHRISMVNSATALTLSQPLLSPLVATTNYRILRQPRILIGEDPITLPKNIIIDFNQVNTLRPASAVPVRTVQVPGGAATLFYEILFAPSGSVIGQGTGSDKIILWLHDLTQPSLVAPDPYAGSPVLVSVQARTGFIAVNPVGPAAPAGDPFLYTKDPRSSGL